MCLAEAFSISCKCTEVCCRVQRSVAADNSFRQMPAESSLQSATARHNVAIITAASHKDRKYRDIVIALVIL